MPLLSLRQHGLLIHALNFPFCLFDRFLSLSRQVEPSVCPYSQRLNSTKNLSLTTVLVTAPCYHRTQAVAKPFTIY